MQKPDVDLIEGLSPAISIEQKTTSRNPRSTVGTVTEIYDYMRLLWARVGVPYSPGHRPADREPDRRRRWSTACWRCRRARGSTCWPRSCAAARASTARSSPSCSGRASSGSRSTARCYELEEVPALDKKMKHDIEVVVDRVGASRRARQAARRTRSRRRCGLADGLAIAEDADGGRADR